MLIIIAETNAELIGRAKRRIRCLLPDAEIKVANDTEDIQAYIRKHPGCHVLDYHGIDDMVDAILLGNRENIETVMQTTAKLKEQMEEDVTELGERVGYVEQLQASYFQRTDLMYQRIFGHPESKEAGLETKLNQLQASMRMIQNIGWAIILGLIALGIQNLFSR